MQLQQRTLQGTEADAREVPDTLLYCDECDDTVLRSDRFDHEHDLSDAKAVTEAQLERLEEKVPDHAQLNTQTYRVEFTYEYREVVTVEAAGKGEAREQAEHKRDLNGEYMDTLHTRTEAWSDPSPATIDYLEERDLLPDDHQVTQSDIEELMDS